MNKSTQFSAGQTIRVIYNSACPVCNAGIKYQQGKTSDNKVQYEDVHVDEQLATELGAPLEFVRERLHVVDENQQIQVGIDAFITIWRHSSGERWKAILFSLPLIHAVSAFAYNGFANLLYRWNIIKGRW